MSEAVSVQTPLKLPPVWQSAEELVDLVGIFEPPVQVCALPRTLDPMLLEYLAQAALQGPLQLMETVSKTADIRLERFPEGEGKTAFLNDLSLLRDIVCELVDCDAVGLRVALVNKAMCPGWHIDRLGLRLICTYQGPGTQWLEDQSVDRSLLKQIKNADQPYVEAAEGDIVLLKGALWQENEPWGSIHRSPDITHASSIRVVITMDPLWDS